MSRRCPLCADRELADFEAEPGVVVDFCAGCQGIWCDRHELEGLLGERYDLNALPLPFGEVPREGPPCPACNDAPLIERRLGSGEELVLWDCRACGGLWLPGGGLQRLRAFLPRRASERPPPRPTVPPPPATVPAFDKEISYDSLAVNAFALPAAFVLGILLNVTGARVLVYPIQILIHELGHAVAAWLSGRLAVPLPMGVTFWSGRLALVSLVVLGLLGWLIVVSWRERRPFFLGVGIGLLLIHLYLAWMLSPERSEMWVLFAGIGGELLISAGLAVAFYYRGPEKLRWDFWRWILLLPAATTFTSQVILWAQVRADPGRMPVGSALAGTRDGTGDLERLMNVHGWTAEGILDVYEGISFLGALVLFGHFFFFLVRAYARRNAV